MKATRQMWWAAVSAAILMQTACSSGPPPGPVYSGPVLPSDQAAFLHPAFIVLANDEETTIGGFTNIVSIDGLPGHKDPGVDYGYSLKPGTHEVEVSFLIRQLDKQAAASTYRSYNTGAVGLAESLVAGVVKEALFSPEVVRWKSTQPQKVTCEVEAGIRYQAWARRTAGDNWIAWCKEWKSTKEVEPQAPSGGGGDRSRRFPF